MSYANLILTGCCSMGYSAPAMCRPGTSIRSLTTAYIEDITDLKRSNYVEIHPSMDKVSRGTATIGGPVGATVSPIRTLP